VFAVGFDDVARDPPKVRRSDHLRPGAAPVSRALRTCYLCS